MRMALFAMVKMTISVYCHGSGMNGKTTTIISTRNGLHITNWTAPIRFSQVQSKRKKMVEAAATTHTYMHTVAKYHTKWYALLYIQAHRKSRARPSQLNEYENKKNSS